MPPPAVRVARMKAMLSREVWRCTLAWEGCCVRILGIVVAVEQECGLLRGFIGELDWTGNAYHCCFEI